MINITQEQLNLITSILQKHIPDRLIKAFGSRITGKSKEFSDLDLAIYGDNSIDLIILGSLKEAFSQSDLPFLIDIVDINRISDDFRKLIEKKNITIQDHASP
jgi:uncharacterized protein